MSVNTPQYFICPQPDLRGQESKIKGKRTSREVTFPVSYRYNGGIVLTPKGRMSFDDPDAKWYAGFTVPEPIVPEGYELVSIGVGLQLNARPPYATMLLRKRVN